MTFTSYYQFVQKKLHAVYLKQFLARCKWFKFAFQLLVDEEKFAVDSPTTHSSGQRSHGSTTVSVAVVPGRRHSMFRLYAMLLSLIILLMMIVLGGIMIYRNFWYAQRVSKFSTYFLVTVLMWQKRYTLQYSESSLT